MSSLTLDTQIRELSFSLRCRRLLRNAQITTLGALYKQHTLNPCKKKSSYRKSGLFHIKGFGDVMLTHVEQTLQNEGLLPLDSYTTDESIFYVPDNGERLRRQLSNLLAKYHKKPRSLDHWDRILLAINNGD